MTRRLLPALLVLVSLAGCADAPAPERPGSPGTLSGSITLQAAGGEGELTALRGVVEEFQKAHPGTEIRFVGIPKQGDHIAKLATSFTAGSPPDVFLLNYRRVGAFAERGLLAPPELSDAELDALYEPPLEAFTFAGELACLPQNISSSVAYLNLDLLEAAGIERPDPAWTWEDLEEISRELDARGTAAVGFEPAVRSLAPLVWSAGGEVVDDTETPTRFTLDNPPGRRALQFLDRLQDYGVDATTRAGTDPVDLFAQGRLAILIDSRRSVPALRKSEGLRFDVHPLPRAEAARPASSLLASDAYCVPERSKNPALAAAFARFVVLGPGAEVLAAAGRSVPVKRELATSEVFLDPDTLPESDEVFLDAIPTLRRLPNVAQQEEAEEAADDVLAQFFAGRADLQATLTALDRETRAVYGRG